MNLTNVKAAIKLIAKRKINPGKPVKLSNTSVIDIPALAALMAANYTLTAAFICG